MRVTIVGILSCVCAAGIYSESARAEILPVMITADENGFGSLDFVGPGSIPMPMPFGFVANPTLEPEKGLAYNIIGPPDLVLGDVLIMEQGGGMSDLIRFVNDVTVGDTDPGGGFLFFSDGDDPNEISLADTGLPTIFSTNVAMIDEVGVEGETQYAIYTPTPNQPGFVNGWMVTYIFISDRGTAVPLPASVWMGLGLLGAMVVRKRMSR
jgi:hypothetical protein